MKYTIGDIHGKLDFLVSLITKITNSDSNPEFVFLGDYGDRGENSRGVIDYLIELSGRYKCTFLRGNHDDVLCFILTGKSLFDHRYFVGKSGGEHQVVNRVIDWWKEHGFIEFLKSYDIPEDADIEVIRNGVPKSHIEFYQNTKLFHTENVDNIDFVMVHAFYHPLYHHAPNGDLALAEVSPERHQNLIYDTLWMKPTKEYLNRTKTWDGFCMVVLGHTPTNHLSFDGSFKPVFGNQVVAIDTGSCFGGYLTAYCFDTNEFTFS